MKVEFNELLNELKALDITQTGGDWADNLPDSVWDQHFKGNFTQKKLNIDVDTRRWYETSISVIEIYGGLLGVRHITNMFSEHQDYEDCAVTIEFTEMKEVQVISYEKA